MSIADAIHAVNLVYHELRIKIDFYFPYPQPEGFPKPQDECLILRSIISHHSQIFFKVCYGLSMLVLDDHPGPAFARVPATRAINIENNLLYSVAGKIC
ncbi:MAG: hypothetical protein A2Z19_00070 [Deltaproteobacteria bacterium RBG_16_54_18]|nr:MAG: hypothetical protein A2Z19_00070 [Deltaproteobacteria bacterium RBG_16_54_18]